MKDPGKRIYRTAMLAPFRFVLVFLMVFFYHDFYLSTFQEPKFMREGAFGFLDVWAFHYRYPTEFISLSLLVLTPVIYYGIIRGVRFHERGYKFNQGLPFFNQWVAYENVQQYKLLLPDSILAITTKAGEIHVVADGDIARVIAVLDQHGIHGDLAQDAYVRLIMNVRKFFFVVAGFTAILYMVKKLGLLRFIP